MAFQVGEIEAKITADNKPFQSGIRAAFCEGSSFSQNMQRQLRAVGEEASRLGRTLSMRLTAPIAAFGALALRTAGDFESSMNRVAAISQATSTQLSNMESVARQLGGTTQFSASQAADAMSFLAMAGLEVNQITQAMPSVLNLAAAAQLDMAQAADIATNIMAGFGKEAHELDGAVDVLAKSFTSANTDLSQLGEAMKMVGPVASGFGIQFEETAAAVGFLSDAGIQASSAGTGLRRILSTLAQSAEDLGIKAWRADGSMRSMADIIEDLEHVGITSARAMEVFGDRGGPAMQVLLGRGSEALREMTGELEDAGGTAQRIAERQMEGLKGAILELRSAFEELQLSIADSGLMDMVTGLVRRVTRFVQSLTELSPQLLRNATAFAAVAAAIGPVLAGIGMFMTAIGAISAPVTAAVAVIGVATATIISNWEDVERYFRSGGGAKMWQDLREIVDSTVSAIISVWEEFGDDLMAITRRAFEVVADSVGFALNRINTLMKKFNGEFDTELNIWEDNILTTVDKIDGIIVGTISRAFRIATRSVINFFRATDDEAGDSGAGFIDLQRHIRSTQFLLSNWGFGASAQQAQQQIEQVVEAVRPLRPAIEAIPPVDRIFDPAEATAIRLMREEAVEFGNALYNILQLPDIDFSHRLPDAGSIRDLQSRIALLREEMETTADLSAVRALQAEIDALQDRIEELTGKSVEAGNSFDLWGRMGTQAIDKLVFETERLDEALRSIFRQLASQAIFAGLTGGFSGIAGIFSGGKMHGGGVVGGIGESVMTLRSGEAVFTPAQTRALGLMASRPSSGISESAMQSAFDKALAKHTSKLGPREIFVLSREGGRAMGRLN